MFIDSQELDYFKQKCIREFQKIGFLYMDATLASSPVSLYIITHAVTLP